MTILKQKYVVEQHVRKKTKSETLKMSKPLTWMRGSSTGTLDRHAENQRHLDCPRQNLSRCLRTQQLVNAVTEKFIFKSLLIYWDCFCISHIGNSMKSTIDKKVSFRDRATSYLNDGTLVQLCNVDNCIDKQNQEIQRILHYCVKNFIF